MSAGMGLERRIEDLRGFSREFCSGVVLGFQMRAMTRSQMLLCFWGQSLLA